MSVHFVVFLLGLFGIPLVLLAVGHKLRKRSPRTQAMFRGAICGHCVAGIVAVVWAMIPPETWEPSDMARGFAGLWSLLLFPVAGALAYWIVRRRRRNHRSTISAPRMLP
jgi:cytosine/uracil/thiamine/allantoin permease